jgi:hypothetical protein
VKQWGLGSFCSRNTLTLALFLLGNLIDVLSRTHYFPVKYQALFVIEINSCRSGTVALGIGFLAGNFDRGFLTTLGLLLPCLGGIF